MSATTITTTDSPTGTRMLALYGHPFSSYTQKVLIALYENGTPFELLNLDPAEPVSHSADWLRHWPLAKFPVLVDGDRTVVESSICLLYTSDAADE